MDNLQALYQDTILEHNLRPRNFGRLDNANGKAERRNPLCGDTVSITLRLRDNRIDSIRFTGSGCAICKASASLMTEAVITTTATEARAQTARFRRLVAGTATTAEKADLGQLNGFSAIQSHSARTKCATLPWEALEAALNAGETAGRPAV